MTNVSEGIKERDLPTDEEIAATALAVQFKDDQFHVATATTVDEAKELLEQGFDYVTEKNGILLFRKPKMFKV